MNNTPLVASQPDGEIYLAVSEYNPYKNLPISDVSIPVRFGNEVHGVDASLVEQAVELNNLEIFARFVTLLDLVMNVMYMFMFASPMALIASIYSLLGYYGVRTYNCSLMLAYLVIQYAVAVARVVLFVYVIQIIPRNAYTITFTAFTGLVQIFVCNRIQRFYNTCLKLPYVD